MEDYQLFEDIIETTGMYYYATMNEFEREVKKNEKRERVLSTYEYNQTREVRNNAEKVKDMFRKSKANPNKSWKMNPKEKALLVAELIRENRIKNLKYANNIIDKCEINIPKRVQNHDQFVRYMKTQEMFTTIFDSMKEWEISEGEEIHRYPCLLVPGNFAWIAKSKNDKGEVIYRYYSMLKDNLSTGFDIFDLIQIKERIGIGTIIGFANSRRVLAEMFNIHYKEKEWEDLQLSKLTYNTRVLIHAPFGMDTDYPSLYALVSPYFGVLQHLNDINIAFLSDKEDSVKKESCFFASTSFIQTFLNNKGLKKSHINEIINLLATLGLINKVKEKDIPNAMFELAKKYKGDRPEFNNVNFYTIPKFDTELLSLANDRADQLLKEGITNCQKVSEKVVTKVLGKVIAKSVYGIKSPLTDEEKKVKEAKAKNYKAKQAYLKQLEEERKKKEQEEMARNKEIGIVSENEDLPF